MGRKDLGLQLLEALQPYRSYLRDAQVDEAFDATGSALEVGKKRRPQGTTHRAVDNLVAYGLMTEASAAKRRAKIDETQRIRREKRDGELFAVKRLKEDAVAAGVPEFDGELTIKQCGVDTNGDPQFKYVTELGERARAFYSSLKIALHHGETPPLHGNYGYIDMFAREVLDATPVSQQPALADLWGRLAHAYAANTRWSSLAESYLLLLTVNEQYGQVLDAVPRFSESDYSYLDIRLNAYRQLSLPVPGRLLLRFKSIETDPYSRANPELLAQCMDLVASETGEWNQLLFSRPRREEFQQAAVFKYDIDDESTELLRVQIFSASGRLKQLEPQINDLAREAMNRVREALGIPRIGEGWVSETELYRAIRSAFPTLSVIQYGRPEWLRPQHLDVWIPELRVGIEFHGPQHFAAVEFFGGEEVFTKTVIRDQRKQQLCTENGVTLLVITNITEIPGVLARIREIDAVTALPGDRAR